MKWTCDSRSSATRCVQRGQVPLEQAEHADDEQPRARVEPACGRRGRSGSGPRSSCCAMTRPTNRMLVQSSSNWSATNRFGWPIEVREVRHDRQHRGARKAERFEVLAVELRVAQREIAAVDVGPKLAPAAEALARERAVHADEVLRRRDVVVDERHPVRQRVRGSRRLRSDREVVEQQVVRMAGVDELAIVARQRLEPRDRPSRRRCPTRSRRRRSTRWMPSTSWPMASP